MSPPCDATTTPNRHPRDPQRRSHQRPSSRRLTRPSASQTTNFQSSLATVAYRDRHPHIHRKQPVTPPCGAREPSGFQPGTTQKTRKRKNTIIKSD
ncbi:hypothetical protein F511_47729 [Dorcoceras hygrometricum]|uniref:Uncharacterized protein n=1 Tax=Dorcoceras hygrometricum TaxID=472368 RepID=A0A2Z6ZQF4_9LAMI|nr:hypothetical protein F511_47729 [Dorcoceras hygrometricum]